METAGLVFVVALVVLATGALTLVVLAASVIEAGFTRRPMRFADRLDRSALEKALVLPVMIGVCSTVLAALYVIAVRIGFGAWYQYVLLAEGAIYLVVGVAIAVANVTAIVMLTNWFVASYTARHDAKRPIKLAA